MYVQSTDHDPADDVGTLRQILEDIAEDEEADAQRAEEQVAEYLRTFRWASVETRPDARCRDAELR